MKEDLRARIISAFDAPGCVATGGRDDCTRGPGTQQRFKALHRAAMYVGQQPSQPPTWRGAIGAVLIRLLRRALFWHSAQINCFQTGAAADLEEQAQALEQLQSLVTQQAHALEEQKQELEKQAQSLRDGSAALKNSEAQFRADISRLSAVHDRRLSNLFEEVRRRLPEPMNEGELRHMVSESEHVLDALYATFEDEFRGTREEIMGRLDVYIPLIVERGLGRPDMPIVDLGCGRGEWLELLRNRGLTAHGVDRNRIMVAQCGELGLDAEEGDLLPYLRSLRASSVGMVTLFHVLEHLPTEAVIEIFDHCVRVLKPGGAALFETPNPENIQVGAHTFYTDFTHRNPLPSVSLRFLAESRGLCQAQIWHLNPYPDVLKVPETSETDRRFNSLFYGPRDYALICFKA